MTDYVVHMYHQTGLAVVLMPTYLHCILPSWLCCVMRIICYPKQGTFNNQLFSLFIHLDWCSDPWADKVIHFYFGLLEKETSNLIPYITITLLWSFLLSCECSMFLVKLMLCCRMCVFCIVSLPYRFQP